MESTVLRKSWTPARSIQPLFLDTTSDVMGVMGPPGSAKTSTMVMLCLHLASQQPKGPSGLRQSRVAVVRNTYSRLETGTLNTWNDWIRLDEFQAPIKHGQPGEQRIRFNDVDMQVYFLALDAPEDADKMKGVEFSFFWLNEATEINEAVFNRAIERMGRFPKRTEGGFHHPCILMDYNAPNLDHWIYRKFEEQNLDRYRQIKQPAAIIKDEAGEMVSLEGTHYRLNPRADNLENLDPRYYNRQVSGRSDRWISVFLLNEYGYIGEGRPVYDNYNDKVHYANAELPVYRDKRIPLTIGFDFGLTPAAIIMQVAPSGQLRILDEVIGDNMGIETFVVTRLIPFLSQKYSEWDIGKDVIGWGDPAGNRRADSTETTCFDTLKDHGFKRTRPSPDRSNNFQARKKGVDRYLTTMIGGRPGLLLSSTCPILRQGFLGQYKQKQTPQGDWELVKNPYSHPHEGLQYGCMGLQGAVGENDKARAHAGVNRYNRTLVAADRRAGY